MMPALARTAALALPCLLFGQTAILQVKVVEGDGAVHAPGTRTSRPLTVEVTDETGRPVAAAAASFRLPEEGPGGQFSNGLQTDLVLTGPDGRASVRGIRLNQVSGSFQIRITVAKDQARAGIVSNQYISEVSGAKAATARPLSPAPVATAKNKKHRGRWVILVAVAAGAAGGLAAAASGGGSQSVAQPAAPTPTLSIGTPAVTIGRP